MSALPLYSSHSYLWPLVAPLDSFEEEIGWWCDLLANRYEAGEPLSVLDLGSGGGHHLFHLAHQWSGPVSGIGVDRAPEMVELASELIPEIEFRVADMTDLNLERTFDLVTVHDSFCYLTKAEQVQALFTVVAEHLDPDGMALVKLEATRETFDGPYRYLTNFSDHERDVTVTHFEWDPDPDDTVLEVVYVFLECTPDGVTTREERHQLGLFSGEQLLGWLHATGLEGEFHHLERWDDARENLLLVVRHKG